MVDQSSCIKQSPKCLSVSFMSSHMQSNIAILQECIKRKMTENNISHTTTIPGSKERYWIYIRYRAERLTKVTNNRRWLVAAYRWAVRAVNCVYRNNGSYTLWITHTIVSARWMSAPARISRSNTSVWPFWEAPYTAVPPFFVGQRAFDMLVTCTVLTYVD